MKKNCYKLKGVDCANCGLKIEDKVNKLDGVHFSNYIFMIERLEVLFDENIITDEIIEKTITNTISGVKIVKKTDLEVTMEDIMLIKKKNDKVKMILFRKRR